MKWNPNYLVKKQKNKNENIMCKIFYYINKDKILKELYSENIKYTDKV